MEKLQSNTSTIELLDSLGRIESTGPLVVGTTQLFDENGKIRYIPMPTADPKGVFSWTTREGQEETVNGRYTLLCVANPQH